MIGLGLRIGAKKLSAISLAWNRLIERVLNDSGETVASLADVHSLFFEGWEDFDWLYIPGNRKASKAYALMPEDGSGDLVVNRNSSAWEQSDGGDHPYYKETANHVPRLEYDVDGSFIGHKVDTSITNLLENSKFEDAVTGLIDVDAVLPDIGGIWNEVAGTDSSLVVSNSDVIDGAKSLDINLDDGRAFCQIAIPTMDTGDTYRISAFVEFDGVASVRDVLYRNSAVDCTSQHYLDYALVGATNVPSSGYHLVSYMIQANIDGITGREFRFGLGCISRITADVIIHSGIISLEDVPNRPILTSLGLTGSQVGEITSIQGSSFLPSSSGTVVFWVKAAGYYEHNAYVATFSYGTSSANQIRVRVKNDKLQLNVRADGGYNQSYSTLSSGSFHLFKCAISYDDSAQIVKWAVNGSVLKVHNGSFNGFIGDLDKINVGSNHLNGAQANFNHLVYAAKAGLSTDAEMEKYTT